MPMPDPQGLPEGPGFIAAPIAGRLPLTGITVLAVEDSRFAAEALRLLCQRSGARLRRVETLEAARNYLASHRPDVVLVDLGLPDGNGAELIRALTLYDASASVVLAISGDPDGWELAVRAGAAGFLQKPLESLAAFQQTLLAHLCNYPRGPLPEGDPVIRPDRQALHDDLRHAARMITEGGENDGSYVARFVQGIARSCHDTALEGTAQAAGRSAEGLGRLSDALAQRLRHGRGPFGRD
ncbi:response regulator [Pseudorhodobacter sp.]|uniref:response regulator n=1 Tax=Pseudorhodobacter sp. TaxID=1934400 RepID=UPI0026471413|nr:response regulator [Pseudorhodobacter sp.]MDN5786024.1 response regulator [Pseudorhodobacter sp.]